jgi:dihydropteroate synthase
MGVVNVTPDSFSDKGRYRRSEEAIEGALAMFEEGAAIVDVGGESTRPGKREPLSPAEESGRILPVISGILRRRPRAILSVDTFHAETAKAAIRAGAEIVNDVSGLLWDEAMAGVCAAEACGLVLMHTRGRPGEWRELPPLPGREVVSLVRRDLQCQLNLGLAAGIVRDRIVLDPGFGFGKIRNENYPLFSGLEELRKLGQPILTGVSRKSFLGRTLAPLYGGRDAPVELRENASLAAATAAILAGADIVRSHSVRSLVEAAAIADAILEAEQQQRPANKRSAKNRSTKKRSGD